jgi:fructoselysine 6-kinase
MRRKLSINFNGDLTVDRYMKQNQIHLGGSSLTSAIWARREGAKASVIAAVGQDEEGKKFIERMHEYDIDISHLQQLSGTTSAIEINTKSNGDRVYGEWNPGVLPEYVYKKKDFAFMNKHDALVVTVYDKTLAILNQLHAMYRTRRRKKPLRIVDFGDLSQFGKALDIVAKYTKSFDVFLFGLDKDGDEILINDLRALAQATNKLFIITLERYGSVAYRGHETYAYIGHQLDAIDATGAGDSFLAGFLVSFLKTRDIQLSLVAGSNLAEKVIQKVGAY